MTITIGRFGIDIKAGEVASFDVSGAMCSLSGVTAYSTWEEALALRQQLSGYVDSPDESFVPVTWDEDPSVDGYYRIIGATVDARAGLAWQGIVEFSITLERVRGFAAPLIEAVCLGKLRTNGLGLTARATISVPTSVRSYVEYSTANGYLAQSADVQRLGVAGSVSVILPYADAFVGQYYLAPKNFYDAAATLRVGDRLRVAVGRQIGNAPANWEISNDLLQVRPAAGAGLALQFRMWDVSMWSPWERLELKTTNINDSVRVAMSAPHTITVLSNSPEAVTIRLMSTSTVVGNDNLGAFLLDLTLRRGSRSVSAVVSGVLSSWFALVVPRAGGAALTGGFSKTVGGVSAFVGSAFQASLPADAFKPTGSVKSWAFCFGLTNSTETSQNMLNEYFWAGSEKQTVVAR